MQITGLLLKAKIGRYLMRNGGGLDANIQISTATNWTWKQLKPQWVYVTSSKW